MEDINKILADVQKEGSDPFENVVDTPTESLPEEVPEVEEEKEEEAVPFHKHPRWIEREQELQAMREREEQMATELEQVRKAQQPSQETQVPDWFVELYGDNATAWQKYSEHERARTEEIEKNIITRQQEEQQREVQEADKWTKWVDSEIDKLESEGHKFDRNKFIKTMLDYSPTDENNNLSFEKGIKIYQALEGKPDTAKSDARKQLADTTTNATTKGEPATKDYMTPSDLRNRSMMSL